MQLKTGTGNQIAEGFIALRASQTKLAADLWAANAALKSKLAQSGSAAGRAFGLKFAEGYRSAIERLNGIVTGTLLGGAAAGAGFVGWGVKLAADQEAMLQSYQTMLQSREKAVKLMAEIKQFAISTPYETVELNRATKMLLALGVPAEEIIGTLRRLGDIASALNIPITELAELFGKMRTQGKLLANDIYQLGGRGIPIIAELAKQFGVAESEVMDLVSSGKVGFSTLDKAIKSMTDSGGMFNGMMEKQSQTLNGVLSTMRDQVAEVAMTLGTALMPAVKQMVGSVSEAMPEIQSAAQSVGDAMADAFSTDNIQTFTAALMDSVDALRLMGAYFDEAQLGAARLGRIAFQLNGAVQAWRFAGHQDEYNAALSAFDAGITSLAEQATTRDPKTGRIQNNTDLAWQEYGRRSRDMREQRASAPKAPPEWLKKQLEAITKFKEDTGFVKEIYRMQDSFKEMTKSIVGEFGKLLLGRNGQLLAAGVGGVVKAGRGDDKKRDVLDGGFTSFEGLNHTIQESLLKNTTDQKILAANLKNNTITEQANNLLGQLIKSASKWSVFAP